MVGSMRRAGRVSGVWPMAPPLLPAELDLYARAFPLRNGAAQRPNQRFHVAEPDRRRGWPGEDRRKSPALLGVHGMMISKCDINVHPPTADIGKAWLNSGRSAEAARHPANGFATFDQRLAKRAKGLALAPPVEVLV